MHVIKHRTNSNALFLIELILAILFFSIASAVCIQLFVKSHTISTKSSDLTAAVTQVQSAAEIIKTYDGSFDNIRRLLDATQTDQMLTVSYGSDWNRVSNEQWVYQMMIEFTEDGPLFVSEIQMVKANQAKPIYELEVKKYNPISD